MGKLRKIQQDRLLKYFDPIERKRQITIRQQIARDIAEAPPLPSRKKSLQLVDN